MYTLFDLRLGFNVDIVEASYYLIVWDRWMVLVCLSFVFSSLLKTPVINAMKTPYAGEWCFHFLNFVI